MSESTALSVEPIAPVVPGESAADIAATGAGDTATPSQETPSPGDTVPEASKEPRLFTQEELDAAIGKRLARERRTWEREQPRPAPSTPETPQGELSIHQFESPEAYAEALAERKAAQLVVARETEQRRTEMLSAHAEREESAREKFDDYDSVVQNPTLRITTVMADAIRSSDIGPEVAYHLGSNPKEAARIAQLSPILQAKEIGRLEAKLAAEPPAKKITTAPAPPSPVRANGKPPVRDTTDPRSIETMSVSEWITAENERVRKAQEARYH